MPNHIHQCFVDRGRIRQLIEISDFDVTRMKDINPHSFPSWLKVVDVIGTLLLDDTRYVKFGTFGLKRKA